MTRPVFCVDAFTAEPFAGGPGPRLRLPLLRPGAGIDEDPVTGSAHCTLGPFWAERLGRAVTVLRGQLV